MDTPRHDRLQTFGQVMYRRATGELPEMECARSMSGVLAELYRPGMRVLDVGCGAGHYLRSLRARLDEQVDYCGVDYNADYVELARQAFGATARFLVADAAALPFADGAYDLVFAANLIPNLAPPPTAALSELLRVARRHLIVRALFAPFDYVIRELVPSGAALGGFDGDRGLYNNMYAEDSYRAMLRGIDPELAVEVRPDTDWTGLDVGLSGTAADGTAADGTAADEAAADETAASGEAWRTRVLAGMQVSGQLILDWRFVIASRVP